jgi:hypothetical protein
MKNFIILLSVVILIFVPNLIGQATISSADPDDPEQFVRQLYKLVTFEAGQTPDWDKVRSMFIENAVIVLRTSRTSHTIMNRDEFIQDFKDFIKNSKVIETGFSETVVNVQMNIFEDIAQCFVVYDAHITGSSRAPLRGLDSFELLHTKEGWKIISVLNELPKFGNPMPDKFLH